MKIIPILLFVLVVHLPLFPQGGEVVEMTLHDFMHDYTKPVFKKYKLDGKADKLKRILEAIPAMAPQKDREKWQTIVTKSLQSRDYKSSCGSCHRPFKKSYKAKFRKRPVMIEKDLIVFLKKK